MLIVDLSLLMRTMWPCNRPSFVFADFFSALVSPALLSAAGVVWAKATDANSRVSKIAAYFIAFLHPERRSACMSLVQEFIAGPAFPSVRESIARVRNIVKAN